MNLERLRPLQFESFFIWPTDLLIKNIWEEILKIIPYPDATPVYFDTGPAKGVTGRVLIGKSDGAQRFCMRIFELSAGGYTPQHSHDWEHEIFVHAGKGAVFNNGEWIPAASGSALFIPGNEIHQLRNEGDLPFVFVCLVPEGAPEI